MASQTAIRDTKNLLLVENQLSGGCIYPPIMLLRKKAQITRAQLVPTDIQCNENLKQKVTSDILLSLQNPSFKDKITEYDMREKARNFTFDPTIWIAILQRRWKSETSIYQFYFKNHEMVIASTLLSSKNKRETIRKIQNNHKNYHVLYLCVECLLYGGQRDQFLYEMKEPFLHKEKCHAFLTGIKVSEVSGVEKVVSERFKERVCVCGEMERNEFSCEKSIFYLTSPSYGIQSRLEVNLLVTAVPFDRIMIRHNFSKKPVKVARRKSNQGSGDRNQQGNQNDMNEQNSQINQNDQMYIDDLGDLQEVIQKFVESCEDSSAVSNNAGGINQPITTNVQSNQIEAEVVTQNVITQAVDKRVENGTLSVLLSVPPPEIIKSKEVDEERDIHRIVQNDMSQSSTSYYNGNSSTTQQTPNDSCQINQPTLRNIQQIQVKSEVRSSCRYNDEINRNLSNNPNIESYPTAEERGSYVTQPSTSYSTENSSILYWLSEEETKTWGRIIDNAEVNIRIRNDDYLRKVSIAHPYFFREVLIKKLLMHQTNVNNFYEVVITINGVEKVITTAVEKRKLREIIDYTIHHIDRAGEFPRIPFQSFEEFEADPIKALQSVMIGRSY